MTYDDDIGPAWSELGAVERNHRELIRDERQRARGELPVLFDVPPAKIPAGGDELQLVRSTTKKPSWIADEETDEYPYPQRTVLRWTFTGPRGTVTADLYIDEFDRTWRTTWHSKTPEAWGTGGPGCYLTFDYAWNEPLAAYQWKNRAASRAGVRNRRSVDGTWYGAGPTFGEGHGIWPGDTEGFIRRGEAYVIERAVHHYEACIEKAKRAAPAIATWDGAHHLVQVILRGVADGLADTWERTSR